MSLRCPDFVGTLTLRFKLLFFPFSFDRWIFGFASASRMFVVDLGKDYEGDLMVRILRMLDKLDFP